MKTISRILAILVICCLLAASLPVFAAESYLLRICGTQVTSENAADVLGDGVFSYDPAANRLTVYGNAECRTDFVIENRIDGLTVYTARDVTLSAVKATIITDESLTITGPGRLTLRSEEWAGIELSPGTGFSHPRVTIKNTDVDIRGRSGFSGTTWENGSDEFVVWNSTVRMEATGEGAEDGGLVNVYFLTLEYCGIVEPEGYELQYWDYGYRVKNKDGSIAKTVLIEPDGTLPPNPFRDVKDSHYFFKPVMWAYSHEPQITNGTSADSFSPGKSCTRAEAVTFLWRAAGEPKPAANANPFTDVHPNAYYYPAVLWAVEQGITRGVSATLFSPDAVCTRAQIVTFLWRYMGKPLSWYSLNKFLYTDVKAGSFYEYAVTWAYFSQITKGTEQYEFSPDAPCIRAQVVTFLYRMDEWYSKMRQDSSGRYELVYDNCTWEQAQAAAAAKSGRLASLEYGALPYVQSLICSAGGSDVIWYLGVRRDAEGTEYRCVDKENRLMGVNWGDLYHSLVLNDSDHIHLWLPGEPSFTWKGKPETVVVMYLHPGMDRWVLDDVSADSFSPGRQYGYIIEYGEPGVS